MRITHPESCESKGQISERQSRTEVCPWGSLSSVGKQMEQTDETESNECAVQIQKGEKEADLCLHSHQLFPGVKVTLLYFLLKSLTGRRETMGRRVSQQKNLFCGN